MKTAQPYSIADRVRSELAGTYGKKDSKEWRIQCDLHEQFGTPDSGFDLLPFNYFQQRATPLTVGNSTGGGYLADTVTQGYLSALQPSCALLQLGATQVTLGRGATVMPRATTPLTSTWLPPNEATATTAATLLLGQDTFVPRIQLTCLTISRQQLLQSNADEFVTRELLGSSGADADRQGIVGSGILGPPLGLLNNTTINSTSGTTLAYSTLVTAMTAVANANAVVNAGTLGFLTNPSTAGLLKQRQFSAAAFPIWTGAVPSGSIDGMRAMTTTSCTTGAMIHGDFSRLLIGQWENGLQIAVDPFTQFQSGFVTIRLILALDFVLASAASFQILTGIT